MKIIEHQGKIKLEYELPVKHTTQTNKIRIPEEILEYLEIHDRAYMYKNKEGQTSITTKQPSNKHHTVHVYKDQSINIPEQVIKDIASIDKVVLTLDMSKTDDYKNGLGLLTLRV